MIAALELEDVALCSAWHESLAAEPLRRAPYPSLADNVDLWAQATPSIRVVTEARRQQPYLRRLLDFLERGSTGKLNRSHLDVLAAAHGIVTKREAKDRGRGGDLLARHIGTINAMRGQTEPVPGLVALDGLPTIISSKDIERARSRQIKSFAGVALPARGPILSVSGDVRVIDQIPDDCMLVVENGTCCVNGYVLGRLAASGACEVRDNIAGIVVSPESTIRCRNIINNAYVVAKKGSVHCRNTENPQMVFAGDAIHVAENAVMGTYASPVIRVARDAWGGVFVVSHLFSARRFRNSDHRRLRIVLPWQVTPQDYGAMLDPEVGRLFARAQRKKQRIDNIVALRALADAECEHFASSATTYLLGGDGLRKHVEDMNASQRRLDFLNRVIASIDALSMSAEEQLNQAARQPGAAETAGADSVLSDIEDNLRPVEQEGAIDQDLSAERDELLSIGAELSSPTRRGILPGSVVERLNAKRAGWVVERDAIAGAIRQKEISLQAVLAKVEGENSGGAKASNVEFLVRLLTAAKGRPPDDPLSERAGSVFTRMMLRSIEGRRSRAKTYGETVEGLNQEIRKDAERLLGEFNVVLILAGEIPEHVPTVVGQIESGAVICTERYLVEGTESTPNRRIARDSAGGVVEYRRTAEGIQFSAFSGSDY